MAGDLLRGVGLIGAFVRAHLRQILEYRANFAIGVFAIMARHVASLLTLWVLFSHVQALGGWGPFEALYLYGYVALVNAVHHLLFANTLRVEFLVRDAGFDRYLVRPLPPVFQLMFHYFDDDALGDFIPAIACLVIASTRLGLDYTWETVSLFGMGVMGGSLIHFGFGLLLSSWSFWFIKSRGLMALYTEVRRFTDYPLTVFSASVQWLLTVVIPVAFAGFYPAERLLSFATLSLLAWLSLPVGLLVLAIGMSVWHVGLGRYQSAGS
jgi:ABC-2 type transport system permease protein